MSTMTREASKFQEISVQADFLGINGEDKKPWERERERERETG